MGIKHSHLGQKGRVRSRAYCQVMVCMSSPYKSSTPSADLEVSIDDLLKGHGGLDLPTSLERMSRDQQKQVPQRLKSQTSTGLRG